jgi:hypothetical protein
MYLVTWNIAIKTNGTAIVPDPNSLISLVSILEDGKKDFTVYECDTKLKQEDFGYGDFTHWKS